MPLKYQITTPERIVEEGTADAVMLPTTEGYITILPNHIPLVSTLGAGEIMIRKNGEEFYFATEGGFIEMRPDNQLSILADFAAKADELDVDVIEKAKARAEEMLREKKFENDEQFATIAAELQRELTKLGVARKRRKHS